MNYNRLNIHCIRQQEGMDPRGHGGACLPRFVHTCIIRHSRRRQFSAVYLSDNQVVITSVILLKPHSKLAKNA